MVPVAGAAVRSSDSPRYYTLGPAVRDWISRNVRQTKGEYAGRRIVWDPFQVFYLDELYLIDARTMLRVYQSGLWGLAKKLGKSTIGSGQALYHLCADLNLATGLVEQAPEVYLGAASQLQTGPVFNQTRQFVKGSPRLRKRLRVMRSSILCPENAIDGESAFLRALSGESATAHGFNISAGIIDELHAHADDSLLNVFESSGDMRAQSLTSIISHAGYDEDGALGSRWKEFMEHPLLEQPQPGMWVVRDREAGQLFVWYGADVREDDWEDPATWRKANPASFMTDEKLRRAYLKAKTPSQIANFQRFRCNMWVNVESSFLPTGLWASLRDDDAGRFEKGEQVWGGVDIALKHDCSAVVLAAPVGDGKRIKLKAFIFHHRETGPSMKARAVACLKQLRQDYRLMGVAYDQAYFQDEAKELEDLGFEMVQFGQGVTMTKGTQHFMQDAADRKLCWAMDKHAPELSRHMNNAVARETEAGNRITKRTKSSKKKIDGAVAGVMARELCAVEMGDDGFDFAIV